MTIPVTSSEVLVYAPESLKEIMGEDAPKFRLRAPSERHIRRFRQVCSDEGYTAYGEPEFNAEKIRAIDALWTPEDAQALKTRLTSMMENIRQGIDVTEDDIAWMEELDDQLFDNWKPLRVMRRKTSEAHELMPHVSVSTYVAGWDGLDVPFRLEGGYLPLPTVHEIEKALRKLGEQHLSEGARTLPFVELYAKATAQISMDEDEEKNSPAPSQHGSNPDASTDTRPTDSKSTEASEADKTPSSTSRQTKRRKPS